MGRSRELAELAASYDSGNLFGMKNRIINGAMVIDQRNAGASFSVSNGYTLDRWVCRTDTGSGNTGQQSTTVPTSGFKNSLLVTVGTGASPTASQRNYIQQPIEGLNVSDLNWGSASAATITISFWVRCSLTGTFGGALQNSAGDRSYPFTYTISAANTWEQKSVTVAGDTTGTWLTTNGIGISLYVGLGCGSTFNGTAGSWAAADYRSATGSTNVVSTSGATFYITGVQLEKGSTATSFDYRPYGTELALCQRYYYRNGVSSVTNQMTWLAGVITNSTSAVRCIMRHPVPMRATPTFGYSSIRAYDGTAATAVSSILGNQCSQDMVQVDLSCTGATFTTGRIALVLENGSTAYIDCTAEL